MMNIIYSVSDMENNEDNEADDAEEDEDEAEDDYAEEDRDAYEALDMVI